MFFLFFKLLYSLTVITPAVEPCKDGTRDTVPGAADGAGQHCQRLCRKEVAGEDCGETGILHAYLDGDGTFLGCTETNYAACRPAQQITECVVAEHNGESP